MEVNTNKKQKTQYWMNLYTFYADKACMSVTLVDEEGSVQFKISPVIPGMEGRPQAGVQKFDHQKSLAITLTVNEIMTLITAYETGLLQNTPATFYHAGNNPKTGGLIVTQHGTLGFTINDLTTKATIQYYFNATRIGTKDNPVYCPSEINLLIHIMKSVIMNLPNIKAKLYPEYVKQNNNYNNGSQNTYQAPQMQQSVQVQQQQQMAPQAQVSPQMQQPTQQYVPQQQIPQPVPQPNIAQQPSNLPQSNNIPAGMPQDDNFAF